MKSQKAGLLTERELEILRLAASGLSNRDIAEKLVLSGRTGRLGDVSHVAASMPTGMKITTSRNSP